MEGTDELKHRLAVDPRIGSNRVSSVAFCLEQMTREWEVATVGDRRAWYVFPYREVESLVLPYRSRYRWRN